MLRFFFACLILAVIIPVSSCSKSKDDAGPDLSLFEGRYVGKIGTGTVTPAGYFSLLLKSGGKLERLSEQGNILGEGTWEVSGEYFGAHYFNNEQTIEVTLNAKIDEAKTIGGGWINTGDKHGTFVLNKQ